MWIRKIFCTYSVRIREIPRIIIFIFSYLDITLWRNVGCENCRYHCRCYGNDTSLDSTRFSLPFMDFVVRFYLCCAFPAILLCAARKESEHLRLISGYNDWIRFTYMWWCPGTGCSATDRISVLWCWKPETIFPVSNAGNGMFDDCSHCGLLYCEHTWRAIRIKFITKRDWYFEDQLQRTWNGRFYILLQDNTLVRQL